MANQITINIGATANDGTGDPLRTAFNDVNLNFANVWNTGLPTSNIQFSDNRILTTHTNANLILAPNGVGVVQANVDILPSVNRGQSLGSTGKKWNTVNTYYINADVANVASFGNLTIDVANLHITGGSNGYVLQTDGTGNLTWTAQTGGGGNGTPGGANGQIQFNDAGNFGGHVGFTFNSVTHLITVPGNIIPGGNATQALGNRTHQWKDLWVSNNTIYMNSVPISLTTGNTLTVNGADVVTVSNNANATANIGNFVFNANSLQNLNGGSFNNGDLTHGFTSGLNIAPNGAGVAEFYNTYGNVLVETGDAGTVTNTWKFDITGNVTLPSNTSSINYANGAPYGGSTGTGVVGFDQYNIYNTQGGGLILSNFNYLTAEAETAYVNIPAGNSPGDLQIVQEQGNITINANASQVWSFNADKSLRFPNNSNIVIVDNVITQINSVGTANSAINLRTFDAGGNTTASSFFDGTDGTLNFYSYNPAIDTSYNWRFDNGGSFTLPNAPGNVYFGEQSNGPVVVPLGSELKIAADRSDLSAAYIDLSTTGIELFSTNNININNSTTGLTNSDINILSGDDIKLQGRNKVDDTEAEGGDLNIWAGQGANSTQTGFDTGGGGDIQIYAGAGGLAQGASTTGGFGGYVEILAGDGGTSLDSVVGSGGYLALSAGSAQTASDPTLGGWGGGVSINAGTTTRINENGGAIELNTGASTGLGYGAAGYLSINIPNSNVGTGGSWVFTGTGKELNVPADSSIFGANFGNFTVGCAGNTIVTSSNYGANVKNWVFGYTGNLLAPGNIITPDNFVGPSLRTNLSNFNWSAAISDINIGTSTTVVLAKNVFGDPWSGQVTIEGVSGTSEANGNWWYLATDSNSFQLYTDSTLSTPVNSSTWGAYTSGGNAYTLDYSNIVIDGQKVTIRSDGGDYNSRVWEFNRDGQTLFPYMDVARGDVSGGNITGYVLTVGNGTAEAIISTPDGNAIVGSNAQRLVINPGKGRPGTSGEGGDIYLWAGRGGDTNGNGGDVKIRGGYGPGDGQGGYIRVEAGDVQGAGTPGYIYHRGGDVNVGTGGYVQSQGGQGSIGGYISLQGGYGTDGYGGAVTITGGQSAGGLGYYGNVNIAAGTGTWVFDNTSTLTVPGISTGSGTGEIFKVQGSRTKVGITNDANYSHAATISGISPALVYTCTSSAVQSAKVTFVVQSNNATYGWEQFDVAVIQLYGGGVGVTVSNRLNNNPANGDTQVTASINGISGAIEIYLTQPGDGTAYVNYTATEFNIMIN